MRRFYGLPLWFFALIVVWGSFCSWVIFVGRVDYALQSGAFAKVMPACGWVPALACDDVPGRECDWVKRWRCGSSPAWPLVVSRGAP